MIADANDGKEEVERLRVPETQILITGSLPWIRTGTREHFEVYRHWFSPA
jgi:hypothetical protein